MRQHVSSRLGFALAGLCATLAAAPALAQQDRLNAALQVSQAKTSDARASQKRISATADRTRDIVDQYRRLVKEVDGIKTHNEIQRRVIANQEQRKAHLKQSTLDVASVQHQMPGLTVRMLDALASFVELDVPLYIQERRNRIAQLRANMDRSDLSVAEKFRQVLEAYNIEINQYGRKISTYRDTVTVDGGEREVNMLQIGRIALLYQTLDGDQAGVWNPRERRWDELESSYHSSLRRALRVARKQAAISLLHLPVFTPLAGIVGQDA